jgi:hypothetical protein
VAGRVAAAASAVVEAVRGVADKAVVAKAVVAKAVVDKAVVDKAEAVGVEVAVVKVGGATAAKEVLSAKDTLVLSGERGCSLIRTLPASLLTRPIAGYTRD